MGIGAGALILVWVPLCSQFCLCSTNFGPLLASNLGACHTTIFVQCLFVFWTNGLIKDSDSDIDLHHHLEDDWNCWCCGRDKIGRLGGGVFLHLCHCQLLSTSTRIVNIRLSSDICKTARVCIFKITSQKISLKQTILATVSAVSPENRSNGDNFPELNAKSAKSNETTLKPHCNDGGGVFESPFELFSLKDCNRPHSWKSFYNIIWFLDVRKMTTCACLLRHLHLVSIWPCAICALSEIVRFCQKNIFVEKSVASYLKWATSVQIRSCGLFHFTTLKLAALAGQK